MTDEISCTRDCCLGRDAANASGEVAEEFWNYLSPSSWWLHFPNATNIWFNFQFLQLAIYWTIFFFIPRVVSVWLSPSSEARKKPARKKWQRDPGARSFFSRASRPQDLARPFLFLAGFFCVTLDGLGEKGTTHSLQSITSDDFLYSSHLSTWLCHDMVKGNQTDWSKAERLLITYLF